MNGEQENWGGYVQNLAVFERFVQVQRENQAGGERIAGIVSRETGRKIQEFSGFGRIFSIFQGRGSCKQEPKAREGIEGAKTEIPVRILVRSLVGNVAGRARMLYTETADVRLFWYAREINGGSCWFQPC